MIKNNLGQNLHQLPGTVIGYLYICVHLLHTMPLLQAIRRFYEKLIACHNETAVSVKQSRAETLLSEDVRQKWEKEQEYLMKQIVLEDTDDIQQMVNLSDTDEEESSDKSYYVAGMDISFVKGDDVNACAALVVLSYPQMEVVYRDCEMIQLTAPYIPGFLGFREVPFIVHLFKKLKVDRPELMPHVVMVDGNGILHPREFGSACHLGVCLGVPCIGVAKKLFHVDGLEKNAAHQEKIASLLLKGGDTFPLITDSGKTLGMALRSSNKTHNPVYVSPGHLVTMETATRLVHRCCKHRVPEPVRLADQISREYIRDKYTPRCHAQ